MWFLEWLNSVNGATLAFFTSVLTLAATKGPEFFVKRLSISTEYKLKNKALNKDTYELFAERAQEEIAQHKSDLSRLREENLFLSVEKAKLEVANEYLRDAIKKLAEDYAVEEEVIRDLEDQIRVLTTVLGDKKE